MRNHSHGLAFALLLSLAAACGGNSPPAPARDLAVAADLSVTRDLAAAAPDLAELPDLAEPDDLVVPADLRRPPDLAQRLAPICDKIGTKAEGWYAPDGSLICWVQCSGAMAQCLFPGTRSEGWYSSSVGLGCNGMDLIQWSKCS